MKSSQKMKGKSWAGILAFFTSFFIAVSFLILGHFSRVSLLNKNPCKMTYTKIDRIQIGLNSSIRGMGLYKYHTHSGHRKDLNPQPVLFIPGHKGNIDQVRSLASSMHNGDGYFQYFVVDFRNMDSAYHGSSILKQAVFANDAIKRIRALYASQGAVKQDSEGFYPTPNVVVVAHSIGGVVARAMPLLDNHPIECLVSDIIMLSSPTISPPYGVDPSTYDLYNAVNKAWRGTNSNESTACRQAVAATAALNSSPSRLVQNKAQRVKTFNAEWNCPVCARHIRLLSISGGEIDNLVPTSLANLAYLAPNPVNITLHRHRAAESKGKLGFSGLLAPMRVALRVLSPQFLFSTAHAIYSLVAGGNSTVSKNTAANATLATNVTAVNRSTTECSAVLSNESLSNESCSVDVSTEATSGEMTEQQQDVVTVSTDAAAIANQSSTTDSVAASIPIDATKEQPPQKSHWQLVTQEAWSRDMDPYLEPQHYSVRTSQLHLVGFPIDHNAMLWCHQLLQEVTSAMKQLVSLPPDSPVDFNKVLKLKEPIPAAAAVKNATDALPQASSTTSTSTDGSTSNSSVSGSTSTEDVSVSIGPTPSPAVAPTPTKPVRRYQGSSQYQQLAARMDEVIEPIAWLFERNATLIQWRQAANDDYKYMLEGSAMPQLFDGFFGAVFAQWRVLSIKFITTELPRILGAYTITSVFILIVPLVRGLAGYAVPRSIDNWTLMLPTTHFHYDFASILLMRFADFVLPPPVVSRVSRLPLPLLLLFAILVLLVKTSVDFGFWSTVDVVKWYGPVLFTLVAYGLALGLRAVLLAVVVVLRYAMGVLLSVLSTVARYTVWCKPVRKFVRRQVKSLFKTPLRLLGFAPDDKSSVGVAFTLVAVGVSLVATVTLTWDRVDGAEAALGLGTYFIAVVSLLAVGWAMVALVAAIAAPPTDADTSAFLTTLILTYGMFPLLCLPSALFSWELLFGDPSSFAAALPLFDLFGPERIHWCMSVLLVLGHLCAARAHGYARIDRIEAIGLLASAVGGVGSGRPAILATGAAGSSACFHEDGGKLAVFEKFESGVSGAGADGQIVTVCKDVLLGPTFRVVRCACSKDSSLKDSTEWCEWCLCRNCGGKNLPRSHKHANEEEDKLDFNLDLALVVLLIASVVYIELYLARKNSYLYALGILATCHLARDLAQRSFKR